MAQRFSGYRINNYNDSACRPGDSAYRAVVYFQGDSVQHPVREIKFREIHTRPTTPARCPASEGFCGDSGRSARSARRDGRHEELIEAVGTAPGPNGLSAEILKILVQDVVCRDALRRILRDIMNNNIDDSVRRRITRQTPNPTAAHGRSQSATRC